MTQQITITYCVKCHWLLRAAWMGQELLSTFEDQISELSLKPGGSGVFTIEANDTLIWCRKRDGGFPEIADLKRRVRDVIDPDLNLGHVEG